MEDISVRDTAVKETADLKLSDVLATETTSRSPYDNLFASLQAIVNEADYNEVYGVKLQPVVKDVPTQIIIQKFLRANANDIDKAKEQLLATLKWRKQFNPLKAKDEAFSKERFEGLGYVILLDDGSPVTFNIYSAVKDNETTFKDISGFIRWRIALMELSISKLNLAEATEPLPDYGVGLDPYQCMQVHDYLNVSFLRQDSFVKAAIKEAIDIFSKYYPETLSRKFFVNVPFVMGWVFAAVKIIVPKETLRKFTMMSYGSNLHIELGREVPKVYGGEAEPLHKIGDGLKLE